MDKYKCDIKGLILVFKDFRDLVFEDLPQYGEFCLLELKDGRLTAGAWYPDDEKQGEKLSGYFLRGLADKVLSDDVARWHRLNCYDLSKCMEEDDTEIINLKADKDKGYSVEVKDFKSWRDGEFPKSEQYCLLILMDGSLSGGRWERWRIDDNDGHFEHSSGGFNISKEKVWAWTALGDDEFFLAEEENENERLKEEELNKNPTTDSTLFKYGTDISVYYEKALEKLKKDYPWATLTQMKKKTVWEITPKCGKYVFGQVEDIYDGRKIVHEWKDGSTAEEFIDFLYKYAEDKVANSDPEKKFKYGREIKPYLEKAYENVKKQYHWLDKDMIKKDQYCYYSIMQLDGDWEFVSIYGNGSFSECECGSAEEFIEKVENDYRQIALQANKVAAVYEVPFGHVEIHGWNLERYAVSRMRTGDYKVNVTAGDRVAGGSREFFITPDCFEAASYDEFLDRYLKIVPGESFGLTKKDLLKDEELKSFFGY